jgi:hypothetical protein
MQGDFQSVVNDFQAPGVEGDFASTNPYSTVLAGPGGLVAPAGGLQVGKFFWVGPQGQCSQSFVAGYQVAFLGRNQQGLITVFLESNTLGVPEGFMVTGFNGGDFWARFPAGGTVGQNVYADPNDGTPLAGATAPTLGTVTAVTGFTGTATLVLNSAVLTVVTATRGPLNVGDTVAGTDIPSGTTILNQLTGDAGAVGTYTMSAEATATVGSAEAITATSVGMLVTAVADGALTVGDQLTGTGVTAGTSVLSQVQPFKGVATVGTLPSTPSTALNVTSVQPGTDLLRVGASLVGAGIPAGTTISSQTSGTPGGVGVYVMSANSTAEAAGVPITTTDSAGGTGLYVVSNAQSFASTTVTVPGTAQATGFTLTGSYSPFDNELGKISAKVS